MILNFTKRVAIFASAIVVVTALAFLPGSLLKAQNNPAKHETIAQSEKTQQSQPGFQRSLTLYENARKAFDIEADTYWKLVSQKRKERNEKRRNNENISLQDYVLMQPPVYLGPARPIEPDKPSVKTLPTPKTLPVVADFVKNSIEQFGFEPERPASEIEFKRIYAKTAAAAGLTKNQIVRIYAFEAGGNGTYDVQAGLEHKKPSAKPISTALGYNQLLTTNSVELLAENGEHFLQILKKQSGQRVGAQLDKLNRKIAVLKEMIEYSKSVPDAWGEHERIAATPKGLGIHALNLDVDVGPLLQTQKLLNSVLFARRKGYQAELTAAELEMMNLTGDGNGFDLVTISQSMREKIPTSNFFQQLGYERNSVAKRNNVVSTLLSATDQKMDTESKLAGAKELSAAF